MRDARIRAPHFRRQGGYSLVEVLIAMALLGVVLISIMGLFVSGRKNVYSGKQMTQAIAVGTHVMETLQPMSKSALETAFAIPAGAGTANTVNSTSFPNSIVRTTTNISGTTDPLGYLARWRDEMENTNKFNKGIVTIVFTPTADPSNNPAQWSTSTVVRMRVFVNWRESVRERNISLDGVKVQR